MQEIFSSARRRSKAPIEPRGSVRPRRQQLLELQTNLADLLARADQLAVPFVAIHLDHAMVLCSEELAKRYDER